MIPGAGWLAFEGRELKANCLERSFWTRGRR
jgi:hypothetical protein